MARGRLILLAWTLACATATASADTSSDLRDGNAAATAGDWATVAKLVEPLLRVQLGSIHLAEAQRLAGLAAYYLQRQADAEAHFYEYLKIDPEGHLDPALYPPEVVNFFNDVKSKHDVELRARRRPHKYVALNLLPPVGQFQNGEPTKGIVIGSLLGALLITNVTSYFVLRSWCTEVTGSETTVTCDDHKDHTHAASTLRSLNIATGLALIATYVYGVYDGVATYRRRERENAQPFVMPVTGGGVAGLVWGF
jgi:hypothetical protein